MTQNVLVLLSDGDGMLLTYALYKEENERQWMQWAKAAALGLPVLLTQEYLMHGSKDPTWFSFLRLGQAL